MSDPPFIRFSPAIGVTAIGGIAPASAVIHSGWTDSRAARWRLARSASRNSWLSRRISPIAAGQFAAQPVEDDVHLVHPVPAQGWREAHRLQRLGCHRTIGQSSSGASDVEGSSRPPTIFPVATAATTPSTARVSKVNNKVTSPIVARSADTRAARFPPPEGVITLGDAR